MTVGEINNGHHHHHPHHRHAVVPSLIAPNPNYAPLVMGLRGSSLGSSVISATSTAAPAVAATTSTLATLPVSTQPEVPATRALNLTELCANASPSVVIEKQLLAYVSSLEAVAGTIQELDDEVQQARPRACEMHGALTTVPTATMAPGLPSERVSTQEPGSEDVAAAAAPPVPIVPEEDFSDEMPASSTTPSSLVAVTSTSEPLEVSTSSSDSVRPTTELPFFDGPPSAPDAGRFERRAKRHGTEPLISVSNSVPPLATVSATGGSNSPSINLNEVGHFGMPSAPASNHHDQVEELARASNDLHALRRDLSSAAEWLRQTNHTVHSALLRALVTYVSSIERRIDNQRQLFVAQARMAVLRSKVAVVKEKMSALLEKLSSIIPHKNNGGGGGGGSGGGSAGISVSGGIAINRVDSQPTVVAN